MEYGCCFVSLSRPSRTTRGEAGLRFRLSPERTSAPFPVFTYGTVPASGAETVAVTPSATEIVPPPSANVIAPVPETVAVARKSMLPTDTGSLTGTVSVASR